MKNFNSKDRIYGTIFGQAVGDAIGFGTEFVPKSKVTIKYPNGLERYEQITRYKNIKGWQPGDWTDDTDQMLCILDSLIELGRLDTTDIACRFKHWAVTDGMGMGYTFSTVVLDPNYVESPELTAIYYWESKDRLSAANGAMMRTSVLGVWQHQDYLKVIANTTKVARLTHADPRCIGCSVAVSLAIAAMLNGDSTKDAISLAMDLSMGYHPEMEKYWGLARDPDLTRLQLDEGLELGNPKVGYTMKTFAAGFWALIHASNYWSGIEALINEGGDADTNCAVAGALLGAKYGLSDIPSHLIDDLVYKHELEQKVDRLMKDENRK